MLRRLTSLLAFFVLAFSLSSAWADDYDDTIAVFKKARESGSYFGKSYGYAVFPTIGKGGVVVGGAYGKGRVYEKGKYVGDTSMTQLTAGAQLGGEAYSQIIFFEDQRAFKEFTGGNFEFGAQAQAVAITAGASAATTTTGSAAGASVTPKRCQERRQVPQGNDDLHGGQGRADVRSQHRRPEVQLQEEVARAARNHDPIWLFTERPLLAGAEPYACVVD